MNVPMLGEKIINLFRFVRRKIVGDDVNFFALRLVDHNVSEKGDKLSRGMPRGGLAEYLTGLGVEGSVQRQRAVAVILEAMALGAPGRERQHRIESIQGLNGRLLVHAEHRRM